MTLIERLRWASAPVHHRSTLLLWGGLAAFIVLGGVLAYVDVPPAVGAVLYLALIVCWIIGACGMIGYMRWFFGQTADEARKQQTPRQKE